MVVRVLVIVSRVENEGTRVDRGGRGDKRCSYGHVNRGGSLNTVLCGGRWYLNI